MKPGRKWVQVLSSLAAALCQGACGHCVPLSAYVIPQLEENSGDPLTMTSEEGSWFASIFVVGCLTGSLVGGYQCDILGRRLSMMLDCVLMAAGLLLIGFAPSTIFLLIGRFATGHSAGSNLVSAPIFVSEISHPELRGTTSTLVMTCYTLGFFISMLFGALMPWRTAVLVYSSTSLVSLFGLAFTLESPTWLARQGRHERAAESLLFYRGCPEVVKQELENIKENLRKGGGESSLSAMEKWKKVASRALSSQFLKPFLLLNMILNIGLEWAGFPALAFYMHSVLKQLQLPFSEYWVAVALGGYRSALVLSLSFIMYRAPRRAAYLGSGSLVALGGASLGCYSWIAPSLASYPWTNYLPLFSVILMYTGFGLGYGPIVFMLQGELLPADMRSFGCALLGIIDNVSLFISVKLVPTIIASLGIGGAFLMYSGFCTLTLITAFFAMPETKGLSLEQIEAKYRGEASKRPRTISMSTV